MKNSRALVAIVSVAFLIAIAAMAGHAASAAGPAPINLGTAAIFSVLGGAAVTNTGPTTTDRDVGVWAGTSVSGFTGPPNGTAGGTIHAGDSVAQQAQSDLGAAYVVAAGAPVTTSHTALGGLTLVGGVYDSGGATLDLTGTLTLDGQNDPSSVWIFKASSDLITASSSRVSFINGASPCNVFWQVTSSASLGSGSFFGGTILALTSVTVANGVVVQGRALARNGNVTLINDTFVTSACSAAPPVPPTRPPFTVAPSASPTPVPPPITTLTPAPVVAPTATPIGAATPIVTPTAAPTAAPAVAATKTLPATNTAESWNPLALLGLALVGFGALLLLRRPLRNF